MERVSFTGQVAIVTGAGRGIGRAYAIEMARRGAAIIVNDIGGVGTAEGARADQVVNEIRAAGGKAVASYDDVATIDGGQAITDTAVGEFGTVDIVINNAGFLRRAMFDAMVLEHAREVISLHLLGAFYVTQPAWKIMLAKRYGRVLMTSSGASFGMQGNSNYSAAKAGVLGLTNALAEEGRTHGVLVNAILPYAKTMITADSPAIGPDSQQNVAMQNELGPRMTTDSVVAAALYLASSECTITGQAISAVAGRYARAFMGLTDGWLRADVEGVTVEEFRDHLNQVIDPTRTSEPKSLGGELRPIIDRLKTTRS